MFRRGFHLEYLWGGLSLMCVVGVSFSGRWAPVVGAAVCERVALAVFRWEEEVVV